MVDVAVPGDKSLSHRALIFASLADGRSRLSGLLDSADTRATAAALAALGVEGVPSGPLDRAEIVGRGSSGWRRPERVIDCANSGTTARLLLGALSGCPFEAELTGDGSLRTRPMRRVTEPLAAAGAVFQEVGQPDRLPIRVTGRRPLAALEHHSPRSSAQVKSALLLAGITGHTAVRVSEPVLSRDHTERLLRSMGAPLLVRDGTRPEITLEQATVLAPLELRIPGDISAAAFFLGLGAAIGGVRVRDVGLNPGRAGALAVLGRMGAEVEITSSAERAGEPVGDVVVRSRALAGTTVEAGEIPSLLDEVPLLAALAAVAEGETRFEGIEELRVKETDRVAALSANLRQLGVETEEGPGHLVVVGGRGSCRGRVRSFGDHRIAMAFGVLGALPGNDVVIDGRDAVAISYPGFWAELERVRRELDRP